MLKSLFKPFTTPKANELLEPWDDADEALYMKLQPVSSDKEISNITDYMAERFAGGTMIQEDLEMSNEEELSKRGRKRKRRAKKEKMLVVTKE